VVQKEPSKKKPPKRVGRGSNVSSFRPPADENNDKGFEGENDTSRTNLRGHPIRVETHWRSAGLACREGEKA